MAAVVRGGVRTWSGNKDDEGHYEFKVTHIVKAAVTDGPYAVLNASGLPQTGSVWNLEGTPYNRAFCYPGKTASIHQEKEGDPNEFWRVESKFSTRPLNRCEEEEPETPLEEPQQVSGSFVKYTKEATRDRYGDPIKSSSHEMFRGPQTEFDHNRPGVHIVQNVPALELALFSSMVDTVNDSTLWGLGPRKVKLSNATWERKYYGSCLVYYTRTFDFDIDFKGFDREVLDEGTKALHGHWEGRYWQLDDIDGEPPDKENPAHFDRYKDRKGENTRVLLDGNGSPLSLPLFDATGTGTGTGTGTDGGSPVYLDIEYYDENDFLLLGIPTSF